MRFVRKELGQYATRIVDQIAEALRDEHAVYIARRRLVDLLEIVIGHRMFESDFDCG